VPSRFEAQDAFVELLLYPLALRASNSQTNTHDIGFGVLDGELHEERNESSGRWCRRRGVRKTSCKNVREKVNTRERLREGMRGDASKRDRLACSYDLRLYEGKKGAAENIIDNQEPDITEKRIRRKGKTHVLKP
jgi:hypothetical protein